MPVLERHAAVFPEDLFDRDSLSDGESDDAMFPLGDAGVWHVLHAKPRTEKAFARRLESQGVPYFLPFYERKKRYQRRLVRSFLPMFPGYLFVWGGADERDVAIQSPYLVRFLHVPDHQQLHRELKQIHEVIELGVDIAPERRLQPGFEAEIISGTLAGQRGRIVRRSGSDLLKFVIEVKMLQQGVSVEVDESMIRPL